MTTQANKIDSALDQLRQAGYKVHIIGPFSNGQRLIEVDEVVRNHHEIMALIADLSPASQE